MVLRKEKVRIQNFVLRKFIYACCFDNFEKAIKILKLNTKIVPRLLRITDPFQGRTCLQWAAFHNNVKGVKFFLKYQKINVSAKDWSGRTALQLSLMSGTEIKFERGRIYYQREPTFEIIKRLLEINNNEFDGRFESRCAENVVSSLMRHHIDVVKMVIDCKSFVNYSKHILWHTAASHRRVDCMRYLLTRPEYSPKMRNILGLQPCFYYLKNIIIERVEPSQEEIDFLFELLLNTFESREESSVDLYCMLIKFFIHRNYIHHNKCPGKFEELVKLLLPHNDPIKQIVDKIFRTKLPSDYCLVILIIFDVIKIYFQNSKLDPLIEDLYSGTYLSKVKDCFLQELFALYKANEPLFDEYVTKVVETNWTFNKLELCSLFPNFQSCLSDRNSMQKMFNFTKSLIFHKFNFILVSAPKSLLLVLHSRMDTTYDYLLNIFVPLCKCVNAPIELMKLIRFEEKNCYFNFNETGNVIDDYKKLLERKADTFEVVSLMNQSRMALRKHMFDNYTHYEALSKMYSLDVAPRIKRFICYNNSNLEF